MVEMIGKLNIPLLKRLRQRFLRMQHPKHFDMRSVVVRNECGTAMCIAGHTLNLLGYKVRKVAKPCGVDCCGYESVLLTPSGKQLSETDAMKIAGRELGIPYTANYSSEGSHLFLEFNLQTPKQAAERIQRIIETGKV